MLESTRVHGRLTPRALGGGARSFSGLAGDHDARLDKAVWNTQWMGHPVAEQYAQQANAAIGGNLTGKLFLMHGDVDDNVQIAETMQLADALIRANKSFDLLVMSG
jgi:dipeptidyl aminopeptidase/acylaminoacyl peptidase